MNIPFINIQDISSKSVTALMDINGCQSHPINISNWSQQYPYQPSVNFRIAHNNSSIFLEYHVKESYIRAKYTNPNESVWTDSCVEFFFSPDCNESYYNLEMNCIGTPLLSFRKNTSTEPQKISEKLLQNIDIYSTLGSQPFEEKSGEFDWILSVIIPATLFRFHPSLQFSGLEAIGNFYKCGDELREPHFLSWTEIEHPIPKFHLPQFFGKLNFAAQ